MDRIQKQKDILKTLILTRKAAAKKYSKVLTIRKYETMQQWEERTKLYRYRGEGVLRRLDAKIIGQNEKLTISHRKKQGDFYKVYESQKRIILEIRKRPIVFFQNSMIILNFAELKYGIPKLDLLLMMHLYAEERGFTEEEIKYKIRLFCNSGRLFEVYVRKGYFRQFIKKNHPKGKVETDVWVLSPGITNLVKKLHLMMIGELSLDQFSYLRKKYPYIDNEFDILKQDIINLKSRYTDDEHIKTIQEEY